MGEARNTSLFMRVFRSLVLNLYSISGFYGFYFTLLISFSTILNRINSEVNFKGDYITTVSQSPLVTDFIVVRQLTSLYTSYQFQVLGVSHTDEVNHHCNSIITYFNFVINNNFVI